MRVAVIGAGFAGLSTAKVLSAVGFDVSVFEKAPDIGGVWSATRRYPGLRTQNDKRTYALSDFPMPRSFPQWPSGEQVQAYLIGYMRAFGLEPMVRLQTEVVDAKPTADGTGWAVTFRRADSDAAATPDTEEFDQLVIANGVFSTPHLPQLPGQEAFTEAGGRISAASELQDVEGARDRHVVVVGYGKSACDIAVPLSDVAASTDVIARQLLWKMPRKLGGLLNYKYLMLTRLGEGLFRYQRPRGFERLLHGPGDRIRRQLLGSVQAVSTRQLRLRDLGLLPGGSFEDIARSTVSLTTEGFYQRVGNGRIRVHRDCQITRLLVENGQPSAELSDSSVVPADLIVCGTGFSQAVPFLPADVRHRLTDDNGNFLLFRNIKPVDVARLYFSGYNSSFFSPLSAEMAAIWIAYDLLGALRLPSSAEQRRDLTVRLKWMDERTDGHHAHGTNIIPFSLHNIDEILDDARCNVGPMRRALQWLLPLDPSAYRNVTAQLIARKNELDDLGHRVVER